MARGVKLGMRMNGLEATFARLRAFDKKLRNKVNRSAMTAGSKPVYDAMRGLVQVESGLQKKSLGRVTRVYSTTGTAMFIVGPRTGFKQMVAIKYRYDAQGVRRRRKTPRLVLRHATKYTHLIERQKSFVKAAGEQAKDASAAAMQAVYATAFGEGPTT